MTVHYLGPFGIVVCLGVTQILITYYSSALTIESLPIHVSDARRRRHRAVYAAMFLVFVVLTFSLAKLNDANQYASALAVQHEQMQQEVLRAQLRTTSAAINESVAGLAEIRQAVAAHAPGEERSRMLSSLSGIQESLHQQTMAMHRVNADDR